MKSIVFPVLGCLLFAPIAWAEPLSDEMSALRQQVQQLTELVQQLTTTVQAQQQRFAQLEQVNAPSRPSATGPSIATAPHQSLGGADLSAFNPEIGVVADMVGQSSESSADGDGNDKLSVREIELIFGHPIDPYSRFDSTITFSDFENPDIEEAYITHWGLPGEVKAKLGRMRPRVEKS